MNLDFASVATIPVPDDIEALILRPGLHPLSDEQFAEFCAQYPELRIEMNREGELMIMLPVVSRGGKRNFNLTARFGSWVEVDGTGVGFDSSTGFTLPNGAKRSPNVSWIKRARWDALSEEQKDDFAPIRPDFVVELRSKSDSSGICRKRWKSTSKTAPRSAGLSIRWRRESTSTGPTLRFRFWTIQPRSPVTPY